jgi:hypothetical protein
MVAFASAGVVLVLSVFGLQPAFFPPDQAQPGEQYEIPANIRVANDMRQEMLSLLARSLTLRAQCKRIAAAPHVRVAIELTVRRPDTMARASATAHRYASGLLTVVIEFPAQSMGDFPELLAHELEHVIELIDRRDLPKLARLGSSGVTEVEDGVFETARARAAGKAAAAEAGGDTDPAAAAIGRGVARAARLAWRGLKGFTGFRGTP